MVKILSRRAAVLILPLILASCWFSPAPLLNSENASQVPFVGAYKDPDGSENPVMIQGSGEEHSYRLVQEDTGFDVHFMPVDDEWFVMQMADPVSETEAVDSSSDLEITRNPTEIAGYVVLRWSAGTLRAYKNECNEHIAAVDGVETTKFGCIFADLEALVQATKVYADMAEADPGSATFEVLEPLDD